MTNYQGKAIIEGSTPEAIADKYIAAFKAVVW